MRNIVINNIFKSQLETPNQHLYSLTEVIDYGANTNKLYTKNKVFYLPELISELEKSNTDIFNNEELLAHIDVMSKRDDIMAIPQESLDKILNQKDEITLTDILMNLSIMRSELVYNTEFYKDVLGGYTFSEFTPEFSTAKMKANNLIISNSKLNIVLVSTMSGLVDINSFSQPMSRYVPFKLVKQGEIMADELGVYIDDANREYLASLPHISLTETIATIPCKQYKPFIESDFTIKSLVGIINNITSLKSVIRAYNYALDGLKNVIPREELNDTDWYRGEAVDDSYVSDEGTDKLEIWIKGRKSAPNLNTIFNNTLHLSAIHSIRLLADSTFDIHNFVVDEDLKMTFEQLNGNLYSLMQQGEINDIVYHAVSSLLQVTSLEGTPLERYEEIKKRKSRISGMLNLLEMKLLPIRKKVMDTCDGVDVSDNLYLYKLGRINGGTADSVGIYHPEAKETIMFRMTKIKKPERDDSLTETQINTDPRSEI